MPIGSLGQPDSSKFDNLHKGPTPPKQMQEYQTQLKSWATKMEQEGHITHHHLDEILQQIDTHTGSTEDLFHLAQDLHAHMPAGAANPPQAGQTGAEHAPLPPHVADALAKGSFQGMCDFFQKLDLPNAAQLLKDTGLFVQTKDGQTHCTSPHTLLDKMETRQGPAAQALGSAIAQARPEVLNAAVPALQAAPASSMLCGVIGNEGPTFPASRTVGSTMYAPGTVPAGASAAYAQNWTALSNLWTQLSTNSKQSGYNVANNLFSFEINGTYNADNLNSVINDTTGSNFGSMQQTLNELVKQDPSLANDPDYQSMQTTLKNTQAQYASYMSIANTYYPSQGAANSIQLKQMTDMWSATATNPPAANNLYNSLFDDFFTTDNQNNITSDPRFQQLQNMVNALNDPTTGASLQQAATMASSTPGNLGDVLFNGAGPFYSHELAIILNPSNKIDVSKLDTSLFTPTAVANYVYSYVNSKITTISTEWTSQLEQAGYSSINASQMAAKIATLLGKEARDAYTQICNCKGSISDVISIARNGLQLAIEPSSLSKQSITDCITILSKLYGPSSPGDAINTFNQKIQGDLTTMSSLRYNLTNDLTITYQYTNPHVTGPKMYNALQEQAKTQAQLTSQINNPLNDLNSKLETDFETYFSTASSGGGISSTFTTELGNLQASLQGISTNYNAIGLPQQNTSISQLLYPSGGPSLAQQIKTATQNTPGAPKLLPLNPKSGQQQFFAPINGGVGVWFDTSRLMSASAPATLAGLNTVLDQYFSNCAQSGMMHLNLSFAQLNGIPPAADTIDALATQFTGGNVQSVMAAINATAENYGLTIGLSVGGASASNDSMKIIPPSAQNPGTLALLLKDLIDPATNKPYSCMTSIDFDIEGSCVQALTANMPEVNQFFQNLNAAISPQVKIQLTLAGSISNVGTSTPSSTGGPPTVVPSGLGLLFQSYDGKPSVISQVNLMDYDSGTNYYLTPHDDAHTDYGIDQWVSFLVSTTGCTPTQAFQKLNVSYQDATPYNNVSAANSTWSQNIAPTEIYTRLTGQAPASPAVAATYLANMTPGRAATELGEQLRIDSIKQINSEYPSSPISANTQFAQAAWWPDENRVPPSSPSMLAFPEMDFITQQISDTYPVPPPPS